MTITKLHNMDDVVGGSVVAHLVVLLNRRHIVELGTGDGATAATVMSRLHPSATLHCVNWSSPTSGDNPYRYLKPWSGDSRLHILFGDTRDPNVAASIPDGIDLLYIDSTHTCACAMEEWDLYRPKLKDWAIVIVDDLNHNDMCDFWSSITYRKLKLREGTLGLFEYRSDSEVCV